ncbi:hypothetical protein D3C85_1534390 [compost metagenome]
MVLRQFGRSRNVIETSPSDSHVQPAISSILPRSGWIGFLLFEQTAVQADFGNQKWVDFAP